MSTYIATKNYAFGPSRNARGVRGDLVDVPDDQPATPAEFLAAQGLVKLDPTTAAELVTLRNSAIASANPRAALSALVREGVATRSVLGVL